MRKLSKILILVLSVCFVFAMAGCDMGCSRKTGTDPEKFEYTLLADNTYSIKAKSGETFSGEHVVLPSEYNGVKVTKIAPFAFEDCNFKKIAIPEGVVEVGAYAFVRCTSLKTVEFADSILVLGDGAFSNCTSLVNTVILPENLEKIGSNCFSHCANLMVVDIPASVTQIATDGTENEIFSGCFDVVVNIDALNAVYKVENNLIVKK